MKKAIFSLSALLTLGFYACKKAASDSQITLTPSSTQVAVGQQVSVALSAKANASSWAVSPSSTATKTYGITTSTVNYFTFSAPGTYTVSVRTKSVSYDSTSQSLATVWNAATRGNCTPGVNTASVAITVTGK